VRHTDGGIAGDVPGGRLGSQDGEASFFTVVVWRDQAEHAAQSLSKGSRVVVVGRLQQRAWTAEDGSARPAPRCARGVAGSGRRQRARAPGRECRRALVVVPEVLSELMDTTCRFRGVLSRLIEQRCRYSPTKPTRTS
jgi:hypothetical protein